LPALELDILAIPAYFDINDIARNKDAQMAIIRFESRQDPNALSWEDVAEMGLDAVPPEHKNEIALDDDEALVMGETGLAIITLGQDGTVIQSRPYGPRSPATLLPFRTKR